MSKRQKEYFGISSVSRHDLIAIGYDVRRVDDETMERIASELADAYLAGPFWRDLRAVAKAFGIPKPDPA
jgi:hypothetical protein